MFEHHTSPLKAMCVVQLVTGSREKVCWVEGKQLMQ